MEKEEFEIRMSEYKFEEITEIKLHGDRFDYRPLNDSKGHGFVYLWIEELNDSYEVVYVGKAGKTMKSRLSQHKGGFHGRKGIGLKNAEKLKEGIGLGKRYFVYARESPTRKIHGIGVPFESLEELAFMQIFKGKLWNIANNA
ncbi:hypothetical protein EYS14_07200 [Alteromonadaceae bacterium M269]|nr:hypothetical protein EYS14_07200 [Alteromonadaceae bacterium M269]